MASLQLRASGLCCPPANSVARPAAAIPRSCPTPSTSGRSDPAAAASGRSAATLVHRRRCHRRFTAAAAAHASSSKEAEGSLQPPPPLSDPPPAPRANVSTVDDDDAPQISPDELRGAVAGAQLLERSIGESSVDYLSVRENGSFPFLFFPGNSEALLAFLYQMQRRVCRDDERRQIEWKRKMRLQSRKTNVSKAAIPFALALDLNLDLFLDLDLPSFQKTLFSPPGAHRHAAGRPQGHRLLRHPQRGLPAPELDRNPLLRHGADGKPCFHLGRHGNQRRRRPRGPARRARRPINGGFASVSVQTTPRVQGAARAGRQRHRDAPQRLEPAGRRLPVVQRRHRPSRAAGHLLRVPRLIFALGDLRGREEAEADRDAVLPGLNEGGKELGRRGRRRKLRGKRDDFFHSCFFLSRAESPFFSLPLFLSAS